MTFDEFVEELRKAGWVGRNDAQHTHIRELWDSLCYRGLNIPMYPHANAGGEGREPCERTSPPPCSAFRFIYLPAIRMIIHAGAMERNKCMQIHMNVIGVSPYLPVRIKSAKR